MHHIPAETIMITRAIQQTESWTRHMAPTAQTEE
jgi:hypothetical protein